MQSRFDNQLFYWPIYFFYSQSHLNSDCRLGLGDWLITLKIVDVISVIHIYASCRPTVVTCNENTWNTVTSYAFKWFLPLLNVLHKRF